MVSVTADGWRLLVDCCRLRRVVRLRGRGYRGGESAGARGLGKRGFVIDMGVGVCWLVLPVTHKSQRKLPT